jgi:class 3 adenylate cyclase
MSIPLPTPAKYIFLDVVGFSHGRTVDAQADIIEALNRIVESAISDFEIPQKRRILLPTGDGVCIALLNFEKPHDVHLLLALKIIKQVSEFAGSAKDKMRKFRIRVGLNSNTDSLVADVNGRQNIAGAGINTAQRIMSAADGNQILVGEAVHAGLQQFEKYLSSFRRFELIDKHGNRIPAYQYIAKGKTGLNRSVPAAFQNRDMNGTARACGLRNVFPSRNDEVKDALLEDVKNAKRRVWLLGVGLSEIFNLRELLPTLKRKIKTIDVKLLLLDGLRSPAVFRTLLESDLEAFKSIFKSGQRSGRKNVSRHPFFRQRLYRDFEIAYEALKESPALARAIRFYAHNPNCWLAITDDTAYYEPYTFGGNLEQEDGTIGSLLPVFKLQGDAQVNVFGILEDHFRKLWATSDADMFYIGARIEDRERIVRLIFEGRRVWFKNACGVLAPDDEGKKPPGVDRRAYPRRPCQTTGGLSVCWGKAKSSKISKAEIIDYSCESVFLRLEGSHYPAKGKIVTLKVPSDPEATEGTPSVTSQELIAADYLKANLIKPTGGIFKVKRVGDDPSLIALQAQRVKP